MALAPVGSPEGHIALYVPYLCQVIVVLTLKHGQGVHNS